MKTLIAFSLAAVVAAVAGCVVHTTGRVEYVAVGGHVHSDICGHYYWHGGWYVMEGHRHYAGCGHVYMGGMWVHDDGGPMHGNTVVVVAGHVHNDHCGHFYYNGGWYLSNGHHHGPGCGHVNQGGQWVFVDERKVARPPEHEPKKIERKPDPGVVPPTVKKEEPPPPPPAQEQKGSGAFKKKIEPKKPDNNKP
ncbi:MAG: hypothetical protein HY293_14475 [Planctomycetes bacterium]|nr:hypothetical protein [Planctomycetota bacterium]